MEEKRSLKEWIGKNIVLSIMCTLILGALIGAGILYFICNTGKVASAKGGTITEKQLFNKMKSYYSINLVLEDIDRLIVDKKYTLSDDEIEEIENQAKKYIDQYALYGYTEESFLKENGFEDYDDFINYLSIDYKRSIYVYEYIEKQLEENAVQNYYNENAIDKVNTKHILVKTSGKISEEEAQKIAKEIITRLDGGEDFDTLATEYIEKYGENVIKEDLGKMGTFDGLEEGYVEGMKDLNKGDYSKEPVKTSYGYHVIYCIDKEAKTEGISRKDWMSIVGILGKDIINNSSNVYEQALIEMRKEANLKIYDKELKEKYEQYCSENSDNE